VPSIWGLFLAVSAGSILGSLVPALIGKRSFNGWHKAALAALFLAIIVESVALVLVNFDSEFRLLGVNLDPSQLLPASVIGALVGMGGFRSAEDLESLLKKTRLGGPK
jgi:hypothetical protein